MNRSKRMLLGAVLLVTSMGAVPAVAETDGAGTKDAQALTDATGIKGGLCLVVGAKDLASAVSLVKASALYVQILQSDAKVAAQWGLVVATSTNRESIGIRNAAFNPDHYDSDLLNLIVIEDAAALNQTPLATVCRLLVPNGFVAIKNAPAGFKEEARILKMDMSSVAPSTTLYRKPVRPVEWKPNIVRKWNAEPNGHTMGGFTGITSSDGRLFYREMMEVEGERWKEGRSQLFARDAYNGRTLWTLEEPEGWNPGWRADALTPNLGLGADNKGRLFACTSQGQLVCLDAATGKQRFVLMDKQAGGRIDVYDNRYVIACGRVFSAENGKTLWTLPRLTGPRMQFPLFMNPQSVLYALDGDAIYFCTGEDKTLTLNVGRLADGQIQKFPLSGLAAPGSYSGLILSGRHLLIYTDRSVSAVEKTSGNVLWTWTWTDVVRGAYGVMTDGDKLVLYSRPSTGNIARLARLDLLTGQAEPFKTLSNLGEGCNCNCGAFRGPLGDYWVSPWYWISKKTLDLVSGGGLPWGPCGLNQVPGNGSAMLFIMPSRKNRWVTCAASVTEKAPEPKGPGNWKSLQTFGQASSAEPVKEDDWPTFRGSPAMGNAGLATPGDRPVKAWEIQIGLGGKSFGMMSSRRIGLTQAVSAYGLAIVSDIEGQRVVAVTVTDGRPKWVFHVGSRVDYSPTLYNGLCLFLARDGWVYCLDARTGALIWKNLVPAAERYIGGREQIENAFNIQSFEMGLVMKQNILVENGVACVDYELDQRREARQLFFKPETGESVSAVPKRVITGRRLLTNSEVFAERVAKGVSLPRQYAENHYALVTDGRNKGQFEAFDDTLSVAFNCGYGEGDWRRAGTPITAMADNPKPKTAPVQRWAVSDLGMVVDDMVLTPQRVYVVGHYQQSVKKPELLVLAREDGKIVNAMPVEGFPGFMGMSAAGNRLFVATREGKLICYRGEK